MLSSLSIDRSIYLSPFWLVFILFPLQLYVCVSSFECVRGLVSG